MDEERIKKHGVSPGFSLKELAECWGVSERMLWKELHCGKLESIRIGRRVIVTKEQADRYLLRCSTKVFNAKQIASKTLIDIKTKRIN
ncbi:MAG: helix-turn-helix domain-containing protein [Candidatus Obscuribacterales bacterium]|nr:helix-turn-helix domain-containing protein [Candidatus Obscuribacterales bacterium]